jgi:hypothetical protein
MSQQLNTMIHLIDQRRINRVKRYIQVDNSLFF